MSFRGRVLVGVGSAMLLMPFAATLEAQTTNQALRTNVSGQVADFAPLYSIPAGTSEDVLRDMASRAGIIFVGTVTAIKKPSDDTMRDSSAASVVEVDFTVEHPLRGVSAATYAMREWAGMWRDSPRFTVGQRLLMLLHAPSPGGLSSPVDGLDGAIPVRGTETLTAQSAVHSNAQTGQGNDGSAAIDTVDLRWLQAKTLRAQAFADAPTSGPGVTLAGSLPGAPISTTTLASIDNPAEPITTDGLDRVLGLLTAWQQARQPMRSASN